MIGHWSRRRYTRLMQDDAKIKKKIVELEKQTPKEKWDEVAGTVTLPNLNYNKLTKQFSVDLGRGLSVKPFVNLTTHEIRLFPLIDFLKDE
jgi:hypothetical protein